MNLASTDHDSPLPSSGSRSCVPSHLHDSSSPPPVKMTCPSRSAPEATSSPQSFPGLTWQKQVFYLQIINWYFIQTHPPHSIYQTEQLFTCLAPPVKHGFPKDRVCLFIVNLPRSSSLHIQDSLGLDTFFFLMNVANQSLCNTTQRLQANCGPPSSKKHKREKGPHFLEDKIKSQPCFQNTPAKLQFS